jgi:hypothetical protein
MIDSTDEPHINSKPRSENEVVETDRFIGGLKLKRRPILG